MEAQYVADFVLTFFDSKGDLITNKKLQKLLYYIEALSLVYHSSIIEDDFEAWVHGPVVPSVYNAFKKFGYSHIVNDYKKGQSTSAKWHELVKNSRLKKDQIDLLVEVLNKYGVLSSLELENLSHSEIPWLKARGDLGPLDNCNNIIDKNLMKEYYSSLIDVKEK